MLAYISEVFLTICILSQLIYNSKNITNLKNNFPLIGKECFNQVIFVLVLLLLLIYNSVNVDVYTFNNFFYSNGISNCFKFSIVAFSIVIAYIVFFAFSIQKLNFFEFFCLYLYAVLSLLLMLNVENFMSLYLIVEMQTLCFYILASFLRNSAFSVEAGLRYFIPSSTISCVLLSGILLIYAATGTLNFLEIWTLVYFGQHWIGPTVTDPQTVILFGLILIGITFLFKLGGHPFENWVLRVYDGAPLASTVIFAILPKVSIIFLFCKIAFLCAQYNRFYPILLWIAAVLTSIFAILLALTRINLKQLLIISSVAQTAFLFTGMANVIISQQNLKSLFLFILIYVFNSILLWGYMTLFSYSQFRVLSFKKKKAASLDLNILTGLFHRNRGTAIALTILLFSLAGIPPFPGFLSKFLIILDVVQIAWVWLADNVTHTIWIYFSSFPPFGVISEGLTVLYLMEKDFGSIMQFGWKTYIASCVGLILILTSAISVFYYIKLLKIIFFEPGSPLKHKNHQFQIIFLDKNWQKIFFFFGFFLMILCFFLFFPLKFYLCLYYLELKFSTVKILRLVYVPWQ